MGLGRGLADAFVDVGFELREGVLHRDQVVPVGNVLHRKDCQYHWRDVQGLGEGKRHKEDESKGKVLQHIR